MHYCLHLLTKKLPTEKDIEKIMAPYNDETVYRENDDENTEIDYPEFTWDWYQIGGRYKAKLKLKADLNDEDFENSRLYRWCYYEPHERNGRLFWSSLLSTLKENFTESWMYNEEEWFPCLGIYDGFIRVDGARLKDVINTDKLDCYIFILPDGTAVAREHYDGDKFIECKDFDQKYKKALADNMDGFITILDIHD